MTYVIMKSLQHIARHGSHLYGSYGGYARVPNTATAAGCPCHLPEKTPSRQHTAAGPALTTRHRPTPAGPGPL